MSSGVRVVHASDTCRGRAVMLASSGSAPSHVELALATLLGEQEAHGRAAPVVTVRASRRSDGEWIAPALAWIARQGRRPIIRTTVVLPRPVVEAARQVSATVLLEVAHPRLELQRALVGADADPIAGLLLQSQHLRAIGIPVAASLGPLLPTLQERDHGAENLLAHLRAASLTDVHLSVGQLGPGRFAALANLLPWSDCAALLRAFQVPYEPGELPAAPMSARLNPVAATALFHHWRRAAEAKGLRVDACGCAAQCHLDSTARTFIPLQAPELFPSVG